ncbi:site-specific integrase [Weissella cibaria]|uniref:site-specific integrase n=1 Tax=Weissella cibaria TaxID=137591 RepID=UPI00106DFB34
MTQILFHKYFAEWLELYKRGAVRDVTFQKYENTLAHIQSLASKQTLKSLNRQAYQQLLNDYATSHERQTVMDFHHQMKAALLDALDEGLITSDPTRKVVIKGTVQRKHKTKFLHQHEMTALLAQLSLGDSINTDYLVLLIAKTGLRISEALGLTPSDFDFKHHVIKVSKTWDYKHYRGEFAPTKNKSSVRKIPLDWQTAMMFSQLIRDLPLEQPIFVNPTKRIYVQTLNNQLETLCNKAGIPVISLHGLRHSHASLLLYAGVSIATVSRRLGHSTMNTTQRIYLHVIQELENADNDKIMRYLTSLM